MPIIESHRVRKIYANRHGKRIVALVDFSMEVEENQFVTIIGPSGCGKTTFLLLVAGLESVTSGHLLLDGRPVNGPGGDHAIVFQEYLLFPWRTVWENVAFGPEVRGVPKTRRAEIVSKYINLVGLEGFESRYPHELSGGMKQKVAIARALANEPKVILMDEPFGSLDALTRETLQTELLRIWQQAKRTVLFVTHSIDEAIYLADRVVVMSKRPGRIKEMVKIDLPRPRTRDMFASPEFIDYGRHLKRLVWEECQGDET